MATELCSPFMAETSGPSATMTMLRPLPTRSQRADSADRALSAPSAALPGAATERVGLHSASAADASSADAIRSLESRLILAVQKQLHETEQRLQKQLLANQSAVGDLRARVDAISASIGSSSRDGRPSTSSSAAPTPSFAAPFVRSHSPVPLEEPSRLPTRNSPPPVDANGVALAEGSGSAHGKDSWALVEDDPGTKRVIEDVRKQIEGYAERHIKEQNRRQSVDTGIVDPSSRGTLHVRLSHAADLKAADKNGFSDPCACLRPLAPGARPRRRKA